MTSENKAPECGHPFCGETCGSAAIEAPHTQRKLDDVPNGEREVPPELAEGMRALKVLLTRIVAAEAEVARLTAERDAAMAGAVKVKPLVWPDFRDGGTCGHPHHFQYFVTQDHHGSFWAHFDMSEHKTLDDAKAHCDQHYQRAAIQPDPEARQADLAKAWTMGREDAAAWHTMQAETAMGALCCGSDNYEIRRAGRVSDMHRGHSEAIRALTLPTDLAAKIGGEA